MIGKIRNTLTVAAIVLGMTAVPFVASSSVLAESTDEVTKGLQATQAGNGTGLQGNIKTIVNVMLFILGAIAVIMIIIGGIRYTLSNGDATQIKSAKDAILYAVIGLIVALLAYAIVNFVVTQFST